MEACVREVKIWLCDNGLVLNENKSEAIVIRSPHNYAYSHNDFVMDDHLSMASQVSNIMSQRILSPVANCQDTTFSYYHCVQKPDPRPSTSRLDYGNAMLFGIADRPD